MCGLGSRVIANALPGVSITPAVTDFTPFGEMYYLDFISQMPSPQELLFNLVLVIGVIALILLGSKSDKPIAVYLLFTFLIHIISCVYFIFETENFVYTAADFSDIYMKQQIGIWILFVVMMGVVTGFLGSKGYLFKIMSFFALLLYTAVFGLLRYIVFMFILARFSLLYMADMFFTFGPIFDFLYLVSIYSFYADRVQRIYDSPDGEGEWKWL